MRESSLLILLSVLAAACGGESTGGGGGGVGAGGTTTTVSPLAPPDVGMQIASAKITVAAGQEQYACWSFEVPEGGAISLVGLENQIPGGGVHHYAVFTNLEPMTEAGPYECETMGITWGLVAGGGLGTPGVKFPDGAAMNLPPKQHVILQLHLLNATTADLDVDPVRINLIGTKDTDKLPVGLLISGTLDIKVPAHGMDVTVSGGCAVDEPMEHIFAVFPHMHQLGKRIVARSTPAAGGAPTVIADQVWDFKDQGLYSVEASAAVGDQIDVTCHFDNPTETDVNFGLSSSDEMCVSVLYYYPAKTPSKFCGIGG